MKLEDHSAERPIALDVAPLLDVVFLLVIFFAVTTSFIDPQKLELLQRQFAALVVDKAELERQLAAERAKNAALNADLQASQARYDQSQNDLTTTRARVQETEQELSATAASLASERDRASQARIELENELSTQRVAEQRLRLDSEALRRDRDVTRQQVAQLQDLLTAARSDSTRLQAKLAQSQQQQVAERAQAEQRLSALEQERARVAQEALALRAENQTFQTLFAGERSRTERAKAVEQDVARRLASRVRDQSLSITRDQDRLILNLATQVLFDSGSADLKPEGLTVLREVGQLVQSAELSDLDLRVAGHTDNIPISGGRFANNWALSSARAVKVVTFLEEQSNVTGARLSAIGYGEHQPIAANDTPEQRARNRRIELVLLPR